ncbi:hypothetical protein PQX77_009216 [Marasmius sp. AFHP31]|nr:hypothetical protein PQX77_009216 [Marasmius sp. AFHP31]
MPSFRSISLFFVAALATFTAAAPAYTPPTDVYHQGGSTGCDAKCVKNFNLEGAVANIQTSVGVLSGKVDGLKEVHAADVKVEVDALVGVIADVTVAVRACLDAHIDVNVLLGASLTIQVIAKILVDLFVSIAICLKAILAIAVKAELAIIIQLCASVVIALAAFLQVCVQLFVGLAVQIGLLIDVQLLISLCAQLNIKAIVFAFLGLNLSL